MDDEDDVLLGSLAEMVLFSSFPYVYEKSSSLAGRMYLISFCHRLCLCILRVNFVLLTYFCNKRS